MFLVADHVTHMCTNMVGIYSMSREFIWRHMKTIH